MSNIFSTPSTIKISFYAPTQFDDSFHDIQQIMYGGLAQHEFTAYGENVVSFDEFHLHHRIFKQINSGQYDESQHGYGHGDQQRFIGNT